MVSFREWALEHADLIEFLHYNPDTGEFTWQIDIRRTRAGDKAGSINPGNGYVVIKIAQLRYMAHRLAFFYMTKAWPKAQLDHINGDRTDNRWENLREATNSQNHMNKRLPRNNTSGFKGVRIEKRTGMFTARIKVQGVEQHLGTFLTAEAASGAYEAVAKEQFGEFYPNRLRVVV